MIKFFKFIFDKIKSNRIVKNFSYITIGNFFSQLIVLLASIKIARKLGPADFGIYTFLIVQCMLFASLGTFGLRNIQIRSIARRPTNTRLYFSAGLSIYGVGIVFSTILLLVYSYFSSKYILNYIILVFIEIIAINLWDISESVWYGHQRMFFPSTLLAIANSVWVTTILILPNSYFSVYNILLLYVLLHFVRSSINFISVFRANLIKGNVLELFKIIKKLIYDSFPYYINMLLALPTNYLTNNFLEINSNSKELGYFNTNKRISQPLNLVIGLALAAVFPNISAMWVNDKEKFNKVIRNGFGLAILLFGYLSATISVFRTDIVLLLFGKEFLTVSEVVMYQIWFISIFGLFSLIGVVWGATDNQKLIAKFGFLNSLFVTPFLWIGSKLGAVGLSQSYLGSYIVFSPFLWWHFKNTLKVKFNLEKELFFFIGLMVITIILPNNYQFIIKILIFCCFSTIFFLLSKKYFNNSNKTLNR